MAATKIKAEDIFLHTLTRFLETGEDSSASEIAESMGIRADSVRRVMKRDGIDGAVPGLVKYEIWRGCTDEDGEPTSGEYRVFMYGPTRMALRDVASKATERVRRHVSAVAEPRAEVIG